MNLSELIDDTDFQQIVAGKLEPMLIGKEAKVNSSDGYTDAPICDFTVSELNFESPSKEDDSVEISFSGNGNAHLIYKNGNSEDEPYYNDVSFSGTVRFNLSGEIPDDAGTEVIKECCENLTVSDFEADADDSEDLPDEDI